MTRSIANCLLVLTPFVISQCAPFRNPEMQWAISMPHSPPIPLISAKFAHYSVREASLTCPAARTVTTQSYLLSLLSGCAPHRCNINCSNAHGRFRASQLASPILYGHRCDHPVFQHHHLKILASDIALAAFWPLLSVFLLPREHPIQNNERCAKSGHGQQRCGAQSSLIFPQTISPIM